MILRGGSTGKKNRVFWGIAQKKRPDTLNTMQKTPSFCNVPFLNKARKNLKNGIFEKMEIFGSFS